MTDPYYRDEWVTLYLGDCREITEWLTADIMVTDPPYGIRWTQKIGAYRGAGSQTNVPDAVRGDYSTEARDTALDMWGERPFIVFGSWRAPRPRGVAHRLIWHKAGMAPGPANSAFMVQDEEIYVSAGDWRRSAPPLRSVISTRETRTHAVIENGHPTPKPLSLMNRLVDRCPPGIIADPFAGTGSTLMAAKMQGRHAIGIEIDERYCATAAGWLRQDALPFDQEAPA